MPSLLHIDTPTISYLPSSIVESPGFFILETLSNDATVGRYTILGISPVLTFQSRGGYITKNHRTFIDSPADALKRLVERITKLPFDPYLPFSTGIVGFLSFEWMLTFKNKPVEQKDDIGMPDCQFGLYDTVAIIDTVENFTTISSVGLTQQLIPNSSLAKSRALQLKELLTKTAQPKTKRETLFLEISTNIRPDILSTAKKLAMKQKKPIELARTIQVPTKLSAWEIYCMLRKHIHVPLASFTNAGPYQIISFAPNTFLMCRGNKVIAATIKSLSKHSFVTTDMLKSKRYEHLQKLEAIAMNKFCQSTSIQRETPKLVKFNSHSLLLTKTKGIKKDAFNVVDFLGCFIGMPASSKGAAAYPHTKRHIQGGAIGFINADGNFCFSLPLQPIIVKDSIAYFLDSSEIHPTSSTVQLSKELDIHSCLPISILLKNKEAAKLNVGIN